jgi:hypothetical protein
VSLIAVVIYGMQEVTPAIDLAALRRPIRCLAADACDDPVLRDETIGASCNDWLPYDVPNGTVTGTIDVVELPVLDISARCVASDISVTTESARVNNPTPDISFIEYGGLTIPLSSVDRNSAKAICTLADQVASNSPPTKLAKTLNNIFSA